MSCRLDCNTCLTLIWCDKISAFKRCKTLWLLFLWAMDRFIAAAAASSGLGFFRGGVHVISVSTSLPWPSAAPSPAPSPPVVSSSQSSPSPSAPACLEARCRPSKALTHCRLPSTAAMAALIAAFEAPAAASEAFTAARTKRSAADASALASGAAPSSSGAGRCSSAAVVSVTSAHAKAAFSASRPRLIAATARSEQPAASGFRRAAARHCAATSSVA
mmetsp:Transcript_12581/g.44598  ORF Transcript_12581/g.44598 Transcript_12581/m.44598 type:complete len:218 (+) Transcript_12581:861-1514(+)